MEMSQFVTPDGQPVFTAGGRHAWKTHEYKGWIISLEWVGKGKRSPACMVIWPASNVFVTSVKPGMWVIGRRAITQFVGFKSDDTATGGPSEHCWREAREALPILGKDINDRQALQSLVDTVLRFADDLVLMPAAPRFVQEDIRGKAMWDVMVKNKNTGKIMSEASA